MCNELESTTVNNVPLSEMCSSSESLPTSATSSLKGITTQSSHQQKNVTVTKKRPSEEEQLFCKRGLKTKKQATLIEEAVDALKQFPIRPKSIFRNTQ